jgi:phosphotransferase system enzyme I (PtsI)
VGRVFVLSTDVHRVARRLIPAEQVKAEVARLDRALKEATAELVEFSARAQKDLGKDAAAIFHFHVGMLKDKSLSGPMREMIEKERVAAEYAVSQVFNAVAERFRAAGDPVFATKVNDIDDLAERVLNHLMDEPLARLGEIGEGTIIVARDLTPSLTAGLDRTKVVGFATDLGGQTGHTSIVARALGIPAVVGCGDVSLRASDGVTAILDGDRGRVILNPEPAALEEVRAYAEQRRLFQLSLAELRNLPAVTRDGVEIELQGNIEFPEEVSHLLEHGGRGVGLYRTEYLYLTRTTDPTEEDHYRAYKRCVDLLKGRPLTIRTFDLGADKQTQSRIEAPERNPFLGQRSIRYCLANLPMFKRQLRAILRASAHGPVKIMFPLVTSTAEFRQGKFLLNDVMEDLSDEGVRFDPDVPVGMMVEVPAAALMAETFAREVAFFSIGTNDLTQYTLAVDRTNERVAQLFNPAHPAVIRLIRDVVRAARRHSTPVSCCGEAASALEYAILLIGLGVRTLSVTGSTIPQLKRMVRSVTVPACERIARQALSFDSDVQVASYLRDRARQIVPEAFDGRAAD